MTLEDIARARGSRAAQVDLAGLAEKIDALGAQVAELAEQQRRRDELMDEMTPILKEVLKVGTDRLASLEEKGYFAFGREVVKIVDAVVTGYSPEDVALLASSVTGILDTVRALTQPQVLGVMADAGAAVESADQIKPVGMMGMVRAGGEEEVQRGMAVMLEVLRRVGRGAATIDRREQLRRQLASRKEPGPATRRSVPHPGARAEGLTGIERVRAARAAAEAGASPPAPTASGPSATQVPQVPGVAFTAEGFMVDHREWTLDTAHAIAASLGVQLTAAHIELLEAARADHAETGATPNVRRLTRVSGIGTKDLYRMFPKSPGKYTAMIAGLPKPVGCI